MSLHIESIPPHTHIYTQPRVQESRIKMFWNMKYCLKKINCHAPFFNKHLKNKPYKMRKQPKEEALGNRGSHTGRGRCLRMKVKGSLRMSAGYRDQKPIKIGTRSQKIPTRVTSGKRIELTDYLKMFVLRHDTQLQQRVLE